MQIPGKERAGTVTEEGRERGKGENQPEKGIGDWATASEETPGGDGGRTEQNYAQ